MKVRKRIQRLIDRAPRGELRAFRLMPDTWWFAAEELIDLHPSLFLRSLRGAMLVRGADEVNGWAAMRLCVEWNAASQQVRFGVFGLTTGEMVEVVGRLPELDEYEGLQFTSPGDGDQTAQAVDALTSAPLRQLLKFKPGSTGEPDRRKIIGWLELWKPSTMTLILEGTRLVGMA